MKGTALSWISVAVTNLFGLFHNLLIYTKSMVSSLLSMMGAVQAIKAVVSVPTNELEVKEKIEMKREVL